MFNLAAWIYCWKWSWYNLTTLEFQSLNQQYNDTTKKHDQLPYIWYSFWWCQLSILKMSFHVFRQIACMGRCEVTLIAFVWLFSTVRLQMCPQIVFTIACIVTLVAFVWFFSRIFKCFLKSPACEDTKSHWLHLFNFSPLCVFKCLLKSPDCKDAKSHRLHLFDFSPLCIFKWVLKLPAWGIVTLVAFVRLNGIVNLFLHIFSPTITL